MMQSLYASTIADSLPTRSRGLGGEDSVFTPMRAGDSVEISDRSPLPRLENDRKNQVWTSGPKNMFNQRN